MPKPTVRPQKELVLFSNDKGLGNRKIFSQQNLEDLAYEFNKTATYFAFNGQIPKDMSKQ